MQEAAVVEGPNVYPIGSLAEAVGFLSGQMDMDPELGGLCRLASRRAGNRYFASTTL
jgi:magnesium chelatase family protein